MSPPPAAATTELETWRELARRELKGAPLERLTSRGVDGLDLEPLYLDAPLRAPIPRLSRGFLTVGALDLPLADDLASAAEGELAGGADGVALRSEDADDATLSRLGATPLGLVLETSGTLSAARRLAPRLHPATTLAAGLDPTAWPSRWTDPAAKTAELAFVRDRSTPGTIALPLSRWHEAGADAPTELALGLAALAGTIRALNEAGLSAEESVSRITVRISVGSRYLTQLSKLRAWRRLAAGMLSHAGLPATTQPRVWAETSRRSLSRRDPWVNLLRGTAAAFAAVAGGADLVSVTPFDAALGRSDAFSRRLARNVLHLLRDESGLADSHDPAAGAFALESWTFSLQQRAWALFQRLEAARGEGAVSTPGAPHGLSLLAPAAVSLATGWLRAASEARQARLARRQDTLVGVSQYVDHQLTRLARTPAAPPLDARLGGPRDAARWEAFDAGPAPKVAVLTAGPLAEHQARSGWVADLMRVRGAEVHLVDAGAAPDDAALTAAVVAVANIGVQTTVVAVADARHADLVPRLAPRLVAEARCEVVLAGRAEVDPDPFAACGVTRRVWAGLDLVAWLRDALPLEVMAPPAEETAP
jgi:methylmalonyl-CoA mutase